MISLVQKEGLSSWDGLSHFFLFISFLHELQGLERTLSHTFSLWSSFSPGNQVANQIGSAEELTILNSGKEEPEPSP